MCVCVCVCACACVCKTCCCDYLRRDRNSEDVSETSPRLVGDIMETSLRLSRRRRPGVSVSNFRFYKSPESQRLISRGSRDDVSASDILA